MTEFNNKFVPVAPKTFQVLELRDQQIKKSPLSVAARSKIINRSGSNYVGEKEGYGPCSGCEVYQDGFLCNFHLRIELHGGGLLDTGILRGYASMSVYNIKEAAQAANDIANKKGKWCNVGCSNTDRQVLSDRINELIRNHK
jgi:hypothetical protein